MRGIGFVLFMGTCAEFLEGVELFEGAVELVVQGVGVAGETL